MNYLEQVSLNEALAHTAADNTACLVESLAAKVRYVVDPAHGDEPGTKHADFAIAVADDWQRMNVGGRLLRNLEHAAREAGVTHLEGDVLRDNRRALDFMLFRGFRARPNSEEAHLVRVSKAL